MGESAPGSDSRAATGLLPRDGFRDERPDARRDEHRRMRWASRRGMLELDLILAPFVERSYPGLDGRDRARYRELMACQDQELWAWLLGREQPDDPELRQIVERVRGAQRSAVSDR